MAMVRPVGPLFEYVINEDYIAEFFCINQDKPELNCNGKCYLVQMLQEQNKEKHQSFPKINMEDYPIGFIELVGIVYAIRLTTRHKTIPNYSNNYSFLFGDSDFHPPNTLY